MSDTPPTLIIVHFDLVQIFIEDTVLQLTTGNWVSNSQSQSQSHIATDGQSVSMSWCRAQIWDIWPEIFFF
jgi:hypothetical protein